MKTKKFLVFSLVAVLLLSNCATMNNKGKGALIGGGSGAALGSIIGGIAGKGKGAAIGAAVGAAVGSGVGVIVGNKMDKKAEEAAKIEGAQVEKIEDANGLDAVKVTFESGILFGFNSSALSSKSKTSLAEFANVLKSDPDLDIAIFGHTDKVGTVAANEKVSLDRALSVKNYLQQCGVSNNQFKEIKGLGYTEYNENETPEQNRRVEVIMYASKKMIEDAQAAENANNSK
jgi:Outer membrane protein and related peptidoglycan-associated (lipo)proteins